MVILAAVFFGFALSQSPPISLILQRSLEGRQSCSGSEKLCGSYCIPSSDICCVDSEAGCPQGTYCTTGSNGQPGCCPTGEVCGGTGGITTNTPIESVSFATPTYDTYVTSTDSSSGATATPLNCDDYTISVRDGAVYSVSCDITYSGDNTNIIKYEDNLSTMRDCANECERTTSCVAADFFVEARPAGPPGRCYLLSNIVPGTHRAPGVKAAARISDSMPSSTYTPTSSSLPTTSDTYSTTSTSSLTSSAGATVSVAASNVAMSNILQPRMKAEGLAWLVYSVAMAVVVCIVIIRL